MSRYICAWCRQEIDAKTASIGVKMPSAAGPRANLSWHITCSRVDPIWQVAQEMPTLPVNAVLVLEARASAAQCRRYGDDFNGEDFRR